MKPFTLKLRPGFRSYVLAVAVVCGSMSLSALAQDDALLEDTESVLNSEQIDVDGQFSRKQTQAQKLAKLRKKIEREHEQMVQKKIEDIRMQEEIKLGRKLKSAFSGNMQKVDTVSTGQAAPQRVAAPAPALAPVIKKEKNNSIIPTLGLTSIAVEGKESYETELSAGINFESKLTKRFAVGIGLGYSTMKINDINPNNGTGFNSFNTFGTFNTGCVNGFNCFNTFGTNGYLQGREMNYRQMDLNIDGKFFIVPDSKIKPFVGLGIGYRRASLSYSENDPYYNQSIGGFGSTGADSEYSSNYVTGTVSGGADIAFSEVIGARLQLAYTKGLTESSNTDNRTFNNFGGGYDYNQIALEETGRALEGADFGSISAGLIINF